MSNRIHEIRDPIHTFIKFDETERKILDSAPLQRLKHIHQLALTYQLYPGATHKRFEHSLGVMELASRVFDVVTNLNDPSNNFRAIYNLSTEEMKYWRRVIRIAALCHDIGHLPFSHALEKDLLPDGWNHEKLTGELIRETEIKSILENAISPLKVDHVVKLAIGEKAENLEFNDLESLLSQIITSDNFGADRMDYLLRDSLHLGVVYGKFDHSRLIDCLRLLPDPDDLKEKNTSQLFIGIEIGGLHTAEELLLARFFMFSQVYFHHIRRIYDIHLKEFLKEILEGNLLLSKPIDLLTITDNEISQAIRKASDNTNEKGHIHAKRIWCREHFKLLHEVTLKEQEHMEFGKKLFRAACDEFGSENLYHDEESKKQTNDLDFPVSDIDGTIHHSYHLSKTLEKIPPNSIEYIFINPTLRDEARRWKLDKFKKEVS